MSKPVFITGATGFLGRAIVNELLAHGYRVHALVRQAGGTEPGSPPPAWGSGGGEPGSVPPAWHVGDVLDSASLERALAEAGEGAWLVHNAAVISYRTGDGALQREVNVGGTERVLAAARRCGVARAVHVSSVVAVGYAEGEETLDEESPFNGAQLGVDYVTTKRAAEEVALEYSDALDLRVVNPAAIYGPSARASNTERFLRSIERGDLGRFAPPGGMSVVGLADTASGVRLALERGRAGRRYVLAESYLSSRELFTAAALRLGRKPPRLVVPRPAWSAVVAGARAVDAVKRLSLATPQALRLLGVAFRISGARAREELGWTPRPFGEVLDETVAFHFEGTGARP